MSFLKYTIGAVSVFGCVVSSTIFSYAKPDEAMSQETVLGMCNNYCASLTKIVDELPESSAETVNAYNLRTDDVNLILQWSSIARGLIAESEQLLSNVVGPLVVYANTSSTSERVKSSLDEVYRYGMSNIKNKLSVAQAIVDGLQDTTPFRVPNMTHGTMIEEKQWDLRTPEGLARATQNVVDADNQKSFATLLRCAIQGINYMEYSIRGEPTVPLSLDDYCWDQIKPLDNASIDPDLATIDAFSDKVSEASADVI
jgi:hypothetical protein